MFISQWLCLLSYFFSVPRSTLGIWVLLTKPLDVPNLSTRCGLRSGSLYVTDDPSWWWWCSVAQSCPTLCNPMDCSMPGFPALHHFPDCTQAHVHRVGDAIQLSHPLSSPSPPAFNLSQHQGLFQGVSSLHQVAKVLEFQLPDQSFQWTFRLISFRIDWFDLLIVQGTLKSLLQHHSLKVSILAGVVSSNLPKFRVLAFESGGKET